MLVSPTPWFVNAKPKPYLYTVQNIFNMCNPVCAAIYALYIQYVIGSSRKFIIF